MAPLFMCCFEFSEQCSECWDVLVEVILKLLTVLCATTGDLTDQGVTPAIHCSIDVFDWVR